MNGDRQPGNKKGAGLAARNKQIVLKYIDALRSGDRGGMEAAMSQNFVFWRLNYRLSRFEYFDSLERTIFSTSKPRLDILFVASDGDCVSVEARLDFEAEGRLFRGQYNSVFVLEDGEIYELREYGGFLE